MFMAAANDLLILFLGLEVLSIALYILAGYHRRRSESGEAAMKYFVLGAFSSAIFLYGIALVYGATGTTNLSQVFASVAAGRAAAPLLAIGSGLVLVGLGFKVAVVPFHMWTPDVYDGAPSVVTAFMSVGAKAGGFAALLRVFLVAFPAAYPSWYGVMWYLAAATMVVANLIALVQTNVKRMLAYSSIAHAGYLMVALAAANQTAAGAALFYLLAFGMIVRWRSRMFLDYRKLTTTPDAR
jgi:NADH-quinone oxidoreductase subunit N